MFLCSPASTCITQVFPGALYMRSSSGIVTGVSLVAAFPLPLLVLLLLAILDKKVESNVTAMGTQTPICIG